MLSFQFVYSVNEALSLLIKVMTSEDQNLFKNLPLSSYSKSGETFACILQFCYSHNGLQKDQNEHNTKEMKTEIIKIITAERLLKCRWELTCCSLLYIIKQMNLQLRRATNQRVIS